MSSGDTRPILAAEDEESDRMIMELVFRKARLARPLVFVKDGQEAVDYLTGNGQFTDRSVFPLPGLVILDLKMPRMSGFDVLTWLSTQTAFKELPVLVLSSSSDESDIQRARQLGAREYFVKPHSFEKFISIAREMEMRWLSGAPAKLPI
jgi:CheY-like chemotaxis protein